MSRSAFHASLAAAVGFLVASVAPAGVNYEKAPINYSETADDNLITRLETRLASGEARLEFDPQQGYLRSLLEHLEIPVSSQVLTFSKTSLQEFRISPATPRAIYFNDEASVGFVQRGLLEISVADDQLGTAFYTLDQIPDRPIRFRRGNSNCLMCHGAARTQRIPGIFVRSVLTDHGGKVIPGAPHFNTTHRSPFRQRWGGWYVTGVHGDQQHLGNLTLPGPAPPVSLDNPEGQNLVDLSTRFDVSKYLAPHSDLVALMVLEHQADAVNSMVRGAMEVRRARYDAEQSPAENAEARASSEQHVHQIISAAAEQIVLSLLLEGEAELTSPIQGTSEFAEEFARRGPHDSQGRSLRELDLNTRLFRFPCSYMVGSSTFAALPEELRRDVLVKLRGALQPGSEHAAAARFSAEERAAALEILAETTPDWPG